MKRTPLARGTKPLARTGRLTRSTTVKKVNRGRRQSEFERCYLSAAYVRFTKGSCCAACGRPGPCDAAHTVNGGAGRKGGWESLVPLCSGINGCHRVQHQSGWAAIGMTEEGRRRAAANLRLAFANHLQRGDDDDP